MGGAGRFLLLIKFNCALTLEPERTCLGGSVFDCNSASAFSIDLVSKLFADEWCELFAVLLGTTGVLGDVILDRRGNGVGVRELAALEAALESSVESKLMECDKETGCCCCKSELVKLLPEAGRGMVGGAGALRFFTVLDDVGTTLTPIDLGVDDVGLLAC